MVATSTRRCLLLLAILSQLVGSLRVPDSIGRRSLLLGAATSLTTSAAAKADDFDWLRGDSKYSSSEGQRTSKSSFGNYNDVENVLDRAKRNSLTTDNVIYRAVNDILIDPSRIDGCSELQSIYKIDIKAADEVKTTNEALLKLSAAASESSRRNLDGVSPEVLKESYSVGRLVEQRIRERATLINLKLGRECLSDSDSPEYNYQDRRR